MRWNLIDGNLNQKNNYLESVKQYFEKALKIVQAEANFIIEDYTIGKRKFRVNYNSACIATNLKNSIRHLEVPKGNGYDLEIFCLDLSVMKNNIYKPDWPIEWFINGYAKELDTERFKVFYPSEMNRIYLFDQKLNIAIVLYTKVELIPWWEKTFSFRYVFHWWTLGFNAQLIHSGAILHRKAGAYLITGASGSGKSTTCLNLLRAGFNYLGDDYVWIEKEDDWKVYCLYQTVKIVKSTLQERFPELEDVVLNKQLIGSEKYVLDCGNVYPNSMCKSATILGIIIPKINYSKISSRAKASTQSAILSIAPSTLYHLPHNREIAYKKIVKLCVSVPVYSWSLAVDDGINSETFSKFK